VFGKIYKTNKTKTRIEKMYKRQKPLRFIILVVFLILIGYGGCSKTNTKGRVIEMDPIAI